MDKLLTLLRTEIAESSKLVNKKLDGLAKVITQSVVTDVSKTLMENIKTTVEAVVNDKLAEMRKDIDNDINRLSDKLETVQKEIQQKPVNVTHDPLKIVLIGVTEGEHENVENKVQTVIKEGLKLKEVKVLNVERKKSGRPNRPGVIIAQCRDEGDKKPIMEAKVKLHNCPVHSKVHIHSDKPLEPRIQEANLRTIASIIGNNELRVQGSRLVRVNRQHQDRGQRNQVNNEGNDQSSTPSNRDCTRDRDSGHTRGQWQQQGSRRGGWRRNVYQQRS